MIQSILEQGCNITKCGKQGRGLTTFPRHCVPVVYDVEIKQKDKVVHILCFPFKTNQTWLTVVFDLEKWPQTCCYFDVEVSPTLQLYNLLVSVKFARQRSATLHVYVVDLLCVPDSGLVKALFSSYQIHPFFSRCNNDCVRRRKTFNICGRFINKSIILHGKNRIDFMFSANNILM